MSEFNDFDRQPSAGTFQSCFEAIRTCDFYLLLVGNRKGSWYDDRQMISVTQQEFRVAAELADTGKIVAIPFIRSETLAVVRERIGLETKIEEDETVASSSSAYFQQDAEFMMEFVDEIRQRQIGTSQHDQNSEYLWSYSFTDFTHIVDTLRVTLNLQHPIRRQSLLASLKWEILDNFGVLAFNSEFNSAPGPAFTDSVARKLREEANLDASKLKSTTRIGKEHAFELIVLLIRIPRVGQLRKSALESALFSGEFLDYDPLTRTTTFTGTYNVLQRILHEIERLETSVTILEERRIELLADTAELNDNIRSLGFGTMKIDNHDLLTLFMIQDRLQSIRSLYTVLYSVISGFIDDAFVPPLPPTTPLLDQVKGVEQERVSHQQAEAWLLDQRDQAIRIVQEMISNASLPNLEQES